MIKHICMLNHGSYISLHPSSISCFLFPCLTEEWNSSFLVWLMNTIDLDKVNKSDMNRKPQCLQQTSSADHHGLGQQGQLSQIMAWWHSDCPLEKERVWLDSCGMEPLLAGGRKAIIQRFWVLSLSVHCQGLKRLPRLHGHCALEQPLWIDFDSVGLKETNGGSRVSNSNALFIVQIHRAKI